MEVASQVKYGGAVIRDHRFVVGEGDVRVGRRDSGVSMKVFTERRDPVYTGE